MKKIFTAFLIAIISISTVVAGNGLDNKENTSPSMTQQRRGLFNISSQEWFASIGVGAQVFFGDHDKQLSFGERITPKFEISAGKWLTPSSGVRLNINTAKVKGLTQNYDISNGKWFDMERELYHQTFNYFNINADYLFNWSNDAYGVDPARMYNLIPYVGVGLFMVTNHQKGTSFTANLGVLQTFNVSEALNVFIDVKGNVLPDKADGEKGGRNFEGVLSTMIGVGYRF